jgi:hypothetical protein
MCQLEHQQRGLQEKLSQFLLVCLVVVMSNDLLEDRKASLARKQPRPLPSSASPEATDLDDDVLDLLNDINDLSDDGGLDDTPDESCILVEVQEDVSDASTFFPSQLSLPSLISQSQLQSQPQAPSSQPVQLPTQHLVEATRLPQVAQQSQMGRSHQLPTQTLPVATRQVPGQRQEPVIGAGGRMILPIAIPAANMDDSLSSSSGSSSSSDSTSSSSD